MPAPTINPLTIDPTRTGTWNGSTVRLGDLTLDGSQQVGYWGRQSGRPDQWVSASSLGFSPEEIAAANENISYRNWWHVNRPEFGGPASPTDPSTTRPSTGTINVPTSTTAGTGATGTAGATQQGTYTPEQRQAIIQQLSQQFQDARTQGIAANESRYSNILGMLNDRNTRSQAYLAGQGQAERADINQSAQGQQTRMQQGLVNSGLYNSTIMPTLSAGIERNRNRDLGASNERLNQQYLENDYRQIGDIAGVMERRTDSYPSLGDIANLFLDYGNSFSGMQQGGVSLLNGGGYLNGQMTSSNPRYSTYYGGNNIPVSQGVR